jgi:hypothetical protein
LIELDKGSVGVVMTVVVVVVVVVENDYFVGCFGKNYFVDFVDINNFDYFEAIEAVVGAAC